MQHVARRSHSEIAEHRLQRGEGCAGDSIGEMDSSILLCPLGLRFRAFRVGGSPGQGERGIVLGRKGPSSEQERSTC
jgi:hypothetical protein